MKYKNNFKIMKDITKELEKEKELSVTRLCGRIHSDTRTVDRMLELLQKWGVIKIETLTIGKKRFRKCYLVPGYKEINVPIKLITEEFIR